MIRFPWQRDRIRPGDVEVACKCGSTDLVGLDAVSTPVMRKGEVYVIATGAKFGCLRCNRIFGVSRKGRFDLYEAPQVQGTSEAPEALPPLPLRPMPRERKAEV